MSKKQKRMLFRVLASAVLFAVALLLPTEGWLRLFTFLIPYAVIAWDVLWRAVRNIAHGQVFDENFLMSLATVGALATGEYPEAVFVMLFYQVGELFQSYAVDQSRKSITSLMDIRPDYANIEVDGQLRQVDPEDVAVGDTIVIKAGERIPLDGVVLEGTSNVDTAALTGESLPREAQPGDDVISGCVNLSGLLRVRVTKAFEESTVAKILDLVENSSSKKAKAENFITKFARYYTPAVVLAAVALALLPPLFTSIQWVDSIQRALNFLVVSCPCALVISVPLSFFGGIGGASKNGILVKGGNYLEVLAKTELVVFDKTGTLTRGVFNVTAIHPDHCGEAQLLELAALAESYSDHPISRSLKEAYGKELDASRVSNVEELSGRGVRATVDGRQICAGNDKLMEDIGVSWHPCHRVGTTVHVASDGVYLGHIVISDEVKPDAKEAITALKACGVRRTVMLTGDAKAVGESVAQELGLDEEKYSVSIPLGATINMAGAAITISVLTLAAANTLGISVDFPTAFLLSVVASIAACGSSGVAGGSLLLIPMACSLFGIPNDIAMQVVGIGFIIGVVQDSCETALNSSSDVLFTAAAEFRSRRLAARQD